MRKNRFIQLCLCAALFLSVCKANGVSFTSTLPVKATAPTPVSSSECRYIAVVNQVTPATIVDARKNANSGDYYDVMKEIIATIPITIADQLSPEEFTTAMFCGYLENYRSPSIDLVFRLDDFQIVEVRVHDYPNPNISNKFTATLIYSVKPPTMATSGWASGNGIFCDKGWICSKLEYVYVQLVNDNYIMAYPHTGP